MSEKGRIRYVAEVTCGLCEHDFLGIRPLRGAGSGASAILREEGWKLTRDVGWVCPKCVEAPR